MYVFKEGCQEDEARLYSVVQRQQEAQEAPPAQELPYSVRDRAVEQVTQRGCALFLSGDTQKLFGCNPVP